ncbi:MAG: transcription antitermination factor NusB [Fretibacterium sp.]|nr:transcription antitermination factor NusB [Fretibacterium sp.]
MSKQKISHKFESRHRARELAVQFLYSIDLCPWQEFEPALELFLGAESLAEAELPEVKDYCRFLTRGTWDRRTEADELLLRVVTGWRPERMASVERSVLRLTIFEGFLNRELPFKSAISEAVDIARFFGTDESARFVNGVLARVARHLLPEGE